jgi:hypothetical protein
MAVRLCYKLKKWMVQICFYATKSAGPYTSYHLTNADLGVKVFVRVYKALRFCF